MSPSPVVPVFATSAAKIADRIFSHSGRGDHLAVLSGRSFQKTEVAGNVVKSPTVIPKPHKFRLNFPKFINQMAIQVFSSIPTHCDDVVTWISPYDARNTIHTTKDFTTKLGKATNNLDSVCLSRFDPMVEFEDIEPHIFKGGLMKFGWIRLSWLKFKKSKSHYPLPFILFIVDCMPHLGQRNLRNLPQVGQADLISCKSAMSSPTPELSRAHRHRGQRIIKFLGAPVRAGSSS